MHTMWKGSVSFGLVNIPVKMFAATEDKDIRFRYLHKQCNTPIKYEKVCPNCNKEIKEEDIVRGYEYEQGKFVLIDDNDINALQGEKRGKSIEILDFVNLADIDPIYYDKTYYLSPQDTGEKAYNLLREAMNDTGKIAIAKITIRNKESMAALRVYKNVLVMETIFYPDEVREISLVPGVPQEANVNDKEMDMAKKLIENLTETFDASKYVNTYRQDLLELIHKKIEGEEIKAAPTTPQGNVIDIMEALQASLKETEKEKEPKPKKKRTKKQTG